MHMCFAYDWSLLTGASVTLSVAAIQLHPHAGVGRLPHQNLHVSSSCGAEGVDHWREVVTIPGKNLQTQKNFA